MVTLGFYGKLIKEKNPMRIFFVKKMFGSYNYGTIYIKNLI